MRECSFPQVSAGLTSPSAKAGWLIPSSLTSPSLGGTLGTAACQLSTVSGVVSALSKWDCRSKGTGKIIPGCLPCQVCNSRVALLKLCMQELKEKWLQWFWWKGWSLYVVGMVNGLVLHGQSCWFGNDLALNAESSFWSQTFWVISSWEKLVW